MKKVLLILGVTLGLAGCANVNPTVATPNQEVLAVNAYNAAVVTGTNYLRLPVCGTQPCRTQGLSQQVYSALKSGRVARNQVLAALQNNQATPLSALNTLQLAYSIISQIPQQ